MEGAGRSRPAVGRGMMRLAVCVRGGGPPPEVRTEGGGGRRLQGGPRGWLGWTWRVAQVHPGVRPLGSCAGSGGPGLEKECRMEVGGVAGKQASLAGIGALGFSCSKPSQRNMKVGSEHSPEALAGRQASPCGFGMRGTSASGGLLALQPCSSRGKMGGGNGGSEIQAGGGW